MDLHQLHAFPGNVNSIYFLSYRNEGPTHEVIRLIELYYLFFVCSYTMCDSLCPSEEEGDFVLFFKKHF